MPKRIVTSEDIESARDGELRLPADAIVTDRARELAAERGVKLRIEGTPDADSGNPAGPMGNRLDARAKRVVALGSDHGGYELKEYLKRFLSELGYTVSDLGTNSTQAVDYPDFARAVAEAVAGQAAWRGIVIDSAGIGSAMAANKVPGVRAALCYDRATARNSREHNDANVLTLGARLIAPELAREITAVWLETDFVGGRHQKRIDKIVALEQHSIHLTPPAVAQPNESTKEREKGLGFSPTARKPSTEVMGSEALLPAALKAPPLPATGDTGREQLIEAVTREILCRLGDQQACILRGLEIDDAVCPGCDGHCVESCPQKSRRVVAAGAARLGAGLGATQIPADLARLIDHTLLKPEASETDIRRLCAEARQYGFASVCVNPTWVPLCAAELQGTSVRVCTVAGFPLGATATSVKVFETEQAVKLGAREVDMVINVGALKSGHYEQVENEIRALAEACHSGGALLKVILECALLTDQEKVIACRLSQSAGADFVKTSTGFGPGGATAHDVELMRLVVGPEMGVKAAGGVRSYEDLQKMVAAGATRIGASASVKIIREAAGETPSSASQPRPTDGQQVRY
jgi:deoxyribose-phosphate aldolase